jgi:hypothetical protein
MRLILSSCAAALLATAACDDARRGSGAGSSETGADVADEDRIYCAIGGEALERVCTLERQAAAEGMLLIIRAPGGGFRRLRVTGDGRGVVAADGAEPALVTPLGADSIEVSIGGDRYRLPATVRPGTS